MIVSTLFVVSQLLGGSQQMDNQQAFNMTKFALQYMQKDCMKVNSFVCSLHLDKIESASKQVVSGTIYNIVGNSNLGSLEMQLWYQPFVKTLSVHRLRIRDSDIVTSPVYLKDTSFDAFNILDN